MIDTKPLEQQILTPAIEMLGTDASQINEILSLAEHNDILGAAELSQKLWERGIYDVRTLGCYLGGAFVERGLAALPLILDCVLKALTLNWEHLGPLERKSRLCDVSLRWLLTTLLTQIDFHHRAKNEQWEKWTVGWTHVVYKQTIDRCVQLAQLLESVIPGARSRGPLLNLQSTLDGIVRPSTETAGWKAKMANATLVPMATPPPDAEGDGDGSASDSSTSQSLSEEPFDSGASQSASSSNEPAESGDGDSDSKQQADDDSDSKKSSDDSESKAPSDEGDSAKDSSKSAPERGRSSSSASSTTSDSAVKTSAESVKSFDEKPQAVAQLPPPFPTGEVASLPLSPALRVFMRQIDGFVSLMQKRQFKKAAILYEQIQQSITNFDPRFFLPSLFGPFYAQLARQGAQLKSQLAGERDFTVTALSDLCRVDLELFMQTALEE